MKEGRVEGLKTTLGISEEETKEVGTGGEGVGGELTAGTNNIGFPDIKVAWLL